MKIEEIFIGGEDGKHAGLESLISDRLSELTNNAKQENAASPEAFASLPSTRLAEEIFYRTARIREARPKKVFIVGIGGSSQGAKAICSLYQHEGSEIIFLEGVHAYQISNFSRYFDSFSHESDFVIVLVSKSGETIESLANFEAIYSAAEKRFGDSVRKRVLVVTAHKSELEYESLKAGFELYRIPAHVSGRFSFFSEVGLLPAAIAGIDIVSLSSGGISANRDATGEDSVARKLASFYVDCVDRKKTIWPIMITSPELGGMAKWSQQIVAESLGHEKDENSNLNPNKPLPFVSLLSEDLHSLGELLLSPRSDVAITVLSLSGDFTSGAVEDPSHLGKMTSKLGGHTYLEAEDTLRRAFLRAAQDKKIPYVHLSFSRFEVADAGAFMQNYMLAVCAIAKVYNLNPFIQGGVEGYKKYARGLKS